MLRSLLKNRFFLTFGGFALVAAVWNVYISFNDDGRITGRVVGPDGQPVEGATVVLSERTLLVAQPKGNVKTGADGTFRFDGHRLHRIYLEARKQDVGRFGPREYRLYFKGENMDLDEPLQLAGS